MGFQNGCCWYGHFVCSPCVRRYSRLLAWNCVQRRVSFWVRSLTPWCSYGSPATVIPKKKRAQSMKQMPSPRPSPRGDQFAYQATLLICGSSLFLNFSLNLNLPASQRLWAAATRKRICAEKSFWRPRHCGAGSSESSAIGLGTWFSFFELAEFTAGTRDSSSLSAHALHDFYVCMEARP